MTDKNDWDKLFDQLTQSAENEKGKVLGLVSGVAVLLFTTAIVAIAIMIINKGVCEAWPSVAEVFPAIGYLDSVTIAFGIVILKTVLSIFDIAAQDRR